MGIERSKRRRGHIKCDKEGQDDKQYQLLQQDHREPTELVYDSHLLDLPLHLLVDILSRLPPKIILHCRCACQTFHKILREPYFSRVHLLKAPYVAPGLILQDSAIPSGFTFAYLFDLEETSSAISSSIGKHNPHGCHLSHAYRALSLHNTKFQVFQFKPGQVALVGSCNGLLCLRHNTLLGLLFLICNPVLGEFFILPLLTASMSNRASFDHSGFGFCPKSNQYKVISFMGFTSFDQVTALSSRKTVALVHTVGTSTWRNIGEAPCPRTRGSFDCLLNGNLHWTTNDTTASNLICSFNLEAEQFQSVPAPVHFNRGHVNNISWISVGVHGGDLCICYVIGDAQFDVWVMKEYGVKESWTKEFSIDISFYCGLHVEGFHQPIKFLNNGDLLLLYNSKSLVSYNPCSGTFRDFKSLKAKNIDAIAHIPSFISLEDIAKRKNVKKAIFDSVTGHFTLFWYFV